jgi:hypothetical protein
MEKKDMEKKGMVEDMEKKETTEDIWKKEIVEDKEKKEMVDDMEKEDGQLVIEREGSRRYGRCNLFFMVPLFFLGLSWADESTTVQSTHMETHLQNDNFSTYITMI